MLYSLCITSLLNAIDLYGTLGVVYNHTDLKY